MMKNVDRGLVKGEAILVLVSILWGSCFAFQKEGMNFIGPFTLGALRFTIGGLILIPLIMLLSNRKGNDAKRYNTKDAKKSLWKGGILCGTALFLGASFQQVGLVYTTTGKAAFLTSMEIVVVGILSIIITKNIRMNSIIGIVFAISGTYLLCIKSGMSMQYGDILELIGAFFWALQVLFIDKYVKLADAMKLSFIQFITAGCMSAAGMILFEAPHINDIISGAVPILYTAIIEVALCHTLQTIGQKYVPPVIASVTLSMESVFAVIFGVIILSEILSGREIGGMILMLVAVIIIQLPINKLRFKN